MRFALVKDGAKVAQLFGSATIVIFGAGAAGKGSVEKALRKVPGVGLAATVCRFLYQRFARARGKGAGAPNSDGGVPPEGP